ncbi:MAG: D-alanyl-D-alanine carboxypeptidase/D-alanyl-D-alanine-endopeptidase [Legionellaceae bacterium]|nr:D-alanyl-D-alanine carboxypeptidase/D-alanyl-D-alanine-endopeptidase [Legionellaceae bacterium]
MKRILPSLILFILSLTAWAQDTLPLDSLPLDVEKIVKQVDPAINLGALVVDLNTGKTLYSRNASKTFIPASNMKLFSDAAALLALGPNYQFKTELSTDATRLEDGVLNGSIYLDMPGDPSFKNEDLSDLLAKLKTWGIQRIDGNIILVSARHGIDPYGPGWSEKDLTHGYGAPLAPLILDENRLIVTVNPAARAGQNARIELNTTNAGITLNNEVMTNATAKTCGLSYVMDKKNQLTIHGCVGLGQWSGQQKLAIINPTRYVKAHITSDLKKMGIILDGKIKFGKKPKTALLLGTHQSKSIAGLLEKTLKTSDNLYAESLYLHTAEVLHGSPVNWNKAEPIIKNFLEKETKISMNKAVLRDGSGLSRLDQITPEQTVALLKFLHARFPLAYEYISALPVAGRDGTLSKRLKKPSEQGFIRAKTGTMSGITSLSGYMYTTNGHTLAFAIYINKGPKTKAKTTWRYAPLVDKLCSFFLKQTPSNQLKKLAQHAHDRSAYQEHPVLIETTRQHEKKWRHIELALKRALKGKPVAVIYRGDHLLLEDQSQNTQAVWSALQRVNKKYPFSAALHDSIAPEKRHKTPSLLWIKTRTASPNRTWLIQDSAT